MLNKASTLSISCFQDEEGMDLPFAPPQAPDGKYQMVPSGIRPVLQKTRIEVSTHLSLFAQLNQPLLSRCCAGE